MHFVTGLLIMSSQRRAAVLELLENCGVHVQVASGLEEARTILRTRPVDLIFTDTDLPDGDWRDVVSHRVMESLRSEVIVCARWLESKLCAEAFARGAWDVLADALPREECRRTIDSAISRLYMNSLGSRRPAVRVAS